MPAHSFQPERETFGWMCLIALSVGLDLAALQSAVTLDQMHWIVIFVLITACKVVLYGWLAWSWSRWR